MIIDFSESMQTSGSVVVSCHFFLSIFGVVSMLLSHNRSIHAEQHSSSLSLSSLEVLKSHSTMASVFGKLNFNLVFLVFIFTSCAIVILCIFIQLVTFLMASLRISLRPFSARPALWSHSGKEMLLLIVLILSILHVIYYNVGLSKIAKLVVPGVLASVNSRAQTLLRLP